MTIVTIGYRKFVVRKATDAATLMKIMAEALPVESDYRKDREWFWPATKDRSCKVSMEVVADTQLLRSEPPEGEDIDIPVTVPRNRGLRLTGPSIKVNSTTEEA